MVALGGSVAHRLAVVGTALWLFVAGSAWAGDGGTDLGIQVIVNDVCTAAGMTSCPTVPTVTQAILEISGLANTAPDYVRGPQGNLVVRAFNALCSVSGTAGLPVCSETNAINAVNPSAASFVAVSDLAGLTPLAFTTVKGQAIPVPLGSSGTNSLLYAVATPDQNGEIKALTLFYDYLPTTNSNFQTGQVIAKVSLPLQVLKSDGSERLICSAPATPPGTPGCASLAILQISACKSGQGCVNGVNANVVGDFLTPGSAISESAGQLNIQASVSFAPSPNSDRSHLILSVQVPLLVTHANDPAYFGVVPSGSILPVNALSGLPTAFTSEVVPTTKIGVTPQVAPACPISGSSCPPPTITYPFCASFSGNGAGSLNPAVATFLSIGTDATTYLSSPVPPALIGSPPLTCPF